MANMRRDLEVLCGSVSATDWWKTGLRKVCGSEPLQCLYDKPSM